MYALLVLDVKALGCSGDFFSHHHRTEECIFCCLPAVRSTIQGKAGNAFWTPDSARGIGPWLSF